MTIHLNCTLRRCFYDLNKNKLAPGVYKPAEANERDDLDERLWLSPGTRSDATLVDEEDDFGSVETVNWVAGVGDICNGTSRNGNIQSKDARRRRIDHDPRPSSKNALCTGELSVPGNRLCLQHNPNRKHCALRRHCDFWDTDQDGLIYPWDIFTGFRRLGFQVIFCLWAAVTMPVCASYNTQTSWLPHPLLAINLNNIDRNRHGSTTSVYDMDAELDTRRFDAIFNKYAEGKDYLTWQTMYKLWRGQCCANDLFGWFAGGLECKPS